MNTETKEWRIVRHAGCRPMPKMNSTAVRIGDKILFIGGWRRGTPVDDIEIARITTRRDTTEKCACFFPHLLPFVKSLQAD